MAEYEKRLAEASTDVKTQQISADIVEQLEAGGEVAYAALETDEAVPMPREEVGEERGDIGDLVITEEGLAFADAVATERGVMTDEGIAAEGFVATDEGLTAARLTVTPKKPEMTQRPRH